jgi:hypothetical protein
MAFTTINNGSLFMNTKLYTGNGSTQSITGVNFQPDMIWQKERSSNSYHVLTDAVRGNTKQLFPNDASGDATSSLYITSFDSDGFGQGQNNDTNQSGQTYASWNWKAGTAVSGNTSGSGTYKTYTGSVNTTSGFSIIKYVGNGTAGHTIPHHLGAVPKMIIMKRINAAGGSAGLDAWQVYHQALGNTKRLVLNSTGGEDASTTYFNDTTPTSSVFTLGTGPAGNNTDYGYIAYCFADIQGYSKFGSYTGNGNNDGPFVYTGFKPAWIMIKIATGNTNNWMMYDNQRSLFNLTDKTIEANNNGAEGTSLGIDMLSNGFKTRVTGNGTNLSGSTYIYMAFGQSLVGTNNIPNNAR